jgi:hypothetical protein
LPAGEPGGEVAVVGVVSVFEQPTAASSAPAASSPPTARTATALDFRVMGQLPSSRWLSAGDPSLGNGLAVTPDRRGAAGPVVGRTARFGSTAPTTR